MIKVMVFIDGSWFWANSSRLGDPSSRLDFKPDYAKLPQVLTAAVARSLPSADVHVVRTYLFGSYPANFHPANEDAVQRQRDFLAMLTERFHYEVMLFPIDYRGRRVRWADRDPEDEFEPREKCVDIALATNLLYLAAVPYAYDIALVVIGDRDFVPVLQRVRDLGKRVAIASIRGACAAELASSRNEARVKDFDPIWLDNLAGEIAYRDGRASPRANGDGARDYADLPELPANEHIVLRGVVTRLFPEKGFGFIRAETLDDYFFHISDMIPGAQFPDLREEEEVVFEVKRRPPAPGGNGAARHVRPRPSELAAP